MRKTEIRTLYGWVKKRPLLPKTLIPKILASKILTSKTLAQNHSTVSVPPRLD